MAYIADCVTISIRDYGSWQSQQTRTDRVDSASCSWKALMDTVHVE
jgi:hypothetical protein